MILAAAAAQTSAWRFWGAAAVLTVVLPVTLLTICWRTLLLPLQQLLMLAPHDATFAVGGPREVRRLGQTLRDLQDALAAALAREQSLQSQLQADADARCEITLQAAATLQETGRGLQALAEPMLRQQQVTAEILECVERAAQIADESRGMAQRGRDVLSHTVDAMSAIRESSTQIGEITGMIDSIAFETNLLAINAAIEAARAGEDGRGFAVVAMEVRNLAQRSAGFSSEIRSLIESSGRRVNAGVLLANESGITLNNIVSGSETVNEVIAHIGRLSSQQKLSLRQLQASVGGVETALRERIDDRCQAEQEPQINTVRRMPSEALARPRARRAHANAQG